MDFPFRAKSNFTLLVPKSHLPNGPATDLKDVFLSLEVFDFSPAKTHKRFRGMDLVPLSELKAEEEGVRKKIDSLFVF